jgi:hypothetical protein
MTEPKDDAAARKARAKRLEKEIGEVVSGGPKQAPGPPSPRDFIHKRMAELDAKEKKSARKGKK